MEASTEVAFLGHSELKVGALVNRLYVTALFDQAANLQFNGQFTV